MLPEWIAVEHHRLHIVEDWPDSPFKSAVLAAIRSSMASLSRDPLAATAPTECCVCRSRKRTAVAVKFRNTPPIAARLKNVAA